MEWSLRIIGLVLRCLVNHTDTHHIHHTSQVAHQTAAYPSFCSIKWLAVFLHPPVWDVSPSQGYSQHAPRGNFQKNYLAGDAINIYTGSKLKKSLGRLLATSWRNIVARSKFLVASLYKQNNVQVPLVEKSWKCLISSGIAWDTFIQ